MLQRFLVKFKSASFVACFLISILYIFCFNKFRNWHGAESPFIQDVDQYYSYLPAMLIHNDLTFSFPNDYWLIQAENGNFVPKVSMGMAFIYLPGFLIGHAIAYFTNAEMSGYSSPYIWSIYFCSILYALIAFWLLRSFLLKYFSDFAVSLSLVALVLATNLISYTLAWSELPHNYLFGLYVIVLHLIVSYHQSGSVKQLILLAFISGLIVIMRPSEILFLMIPVLYRIISKTDFQSKIKLLASHQWKWAWVILAFFLPIIPQLVYWKMMTGSFLYFSYGSNEKFFFNNPQVLNFLISFKKGWLFYSPVMIFSLIGMFFLKKYTAKFKFILPLFIVVVIYFLSSWWAWWYGGSYGNRAMVQYYAFLAIPLTAFIAYFLRFKWFKFAFPLMLFGLISLNIFQIKLYKAAHLHWDSMSRASYIYLMKHSIKKDMDFDFYYSLLKAPDYEAAQRGEYDYKWYE